MKNKSMTDNYNPSGKGKNSTDNKKDGPVDGIMKKIGSGLKKAGDKIRKAREKKTTGVVGGYKYLTRKNKGEM